VLSPTPGFVRPILSTPLRLGRGTGTFWITTSPIRSTGCTHLIADALEQQFRKSFPQGAAVQSYYQHCFSALAQNYGTLVRPPTSVARLGVRRSLAPLAIALESNSFITTDIAGRWKDLNKEEFLYWRGLRLIESVSTMRKPSLPGLYLGGERLILMGLTGGSIFSPPGLLSGWLVAGR